MNYWWRVNGTKAATNKRLTLARKVAVGREIAHERLVLRNRFFWRRCLETIRDVETFD